MFKINNRKFNNSGKWCAVSSKLTMKILVWRHSGMRIFRGTTEIYCWLRTVEQIWTLTYFSAILHFIWKPMIWFAIANQVTGFYIKCNIGLKWLRSFRYFWLWTSIFFLICIVGNWNDQISMELVIITRFINIKYLTLSWRKPLSYRNHMITAPSWKA